MILKNKILFTSIIVLFLNSCSGGGGSADSGTASTPIDQITEAPVASTPMSSTATKQDWIDGKASFVIYSAGLSSVPKKNAVDELEKKTEMKAIFDCLPNMTSQGTIIKSDKSLENFESNQCDSILLIQKIKSSHPLFEITSAFEFQSNLIYNLSQMKSDDSEKITRIKTVVSHYEKIQKSIRIIFAALTEEEEKYETLKLQLILNEMQKIAFLIPITDEHLKFRIMGLNTHYFNEYNTRLPRNKVLQISI